MRIVLSATFSFFAMGCGVAPALVAPPVAAPRAIVNVPAPQPKPPAAPFMCSLESQHTAQRIADGTFEVLQMVEDWVAAFQQTPAAYTVLGPTEKVMFVKLVNALPEWQRAVQDLQPECYSSRDFLLQSIYETNMHLRPYLSKLQ